MTTTPMDHQRPSLTKKHSASSEKKREQALNEGLRLTIEGVPYEARFGDVSVTLARELRQNTGMGFSALMDTVGADPDVDVISAFVWVARRIKGEQVAFADVEVSYAQILADGFDVAVASGEEEVDLDDPQT